jgi:hypothetical protein
MAGRASAMDLLQQAGDAPDATLPPPLAALWWLKAGGFAMGPQWDRAHAICQTREGDHAHDLVHALAHWIEGDMGNRDYWYRRAGDTRAATIAAEWARIAEKLAKV